MGSSCSTETKVGYQIPAFSLLNQDGKATSFDDLKGEKGLVVFTYPIAGSYGCTGQACSFRNKYDKF